MTERSVEENAEMLELQRQARLNVDARLAEETLADGTYSIIQLESDLIKELEDLRKQNYANSSSATGASGYGQLQVTP